MTPFINPVCFGARVSFWFCAPPPANPARNRCDRHPAAGTQPNVGVNSDWDGNPATLPPFRLPCRLKAERTEENAWLSDMDGFRASGSLVGLAWRLSWQG
jgi:hypothetical protein